MELDKLPKRILKTQLLNIPKFETTEDRQKANEILV